MDERSFHVQEALRKLTGGGQGRSAPESSKRLRKQPSRTGYTQLQTCPPIQSNVGQTRVQPVQTNYVNVSRPQMQKPYGQQTNTGLPRTVPHATFRTPPQIISRTAPQPIVRPDRKTRSGEKLPSNTTKNTVIWFTCPLCESAQKHAATLPCGHAFCATYVMSLNVKPIRLEVCFSFRCTTLALSEKPQCPLCSTTAHLHEVKRFVARV